MVVLIRIYFSILRNEPFWNELIRIGTVYILISKKSPDVAENHCPLRNKMAVVVVVLSGYVRYTKRSDGTPAENLANDGIHVRDCTPVHKGGQSTVECGVNCRLPFLLNLGMK